MQIESADGDMDLVRQALATGLLLNAARLTGTAVTGEREAGTHEYELLRGAGKFHDPAPKLVCIVSRVLSKVP